MRPEGLERKFYKLSLIVKYKITFNIYIINNLNSKTPFFNYSLLFLISSLDVGCLSSNDLYSSYKIYPSWPSKNLKTDT